MKQLLTATLLVCAASLSVSAQTAHRDSVLFVLDGKPANREDINLEDIESIQVLKEEKAIKKYGEKGRYGVVEFTSKKQ